MIHQRYFRPGQKILLHPKDPTTPDGYAGLLSSYLQGGGDDYFDLKLPYGADAASQYPFHEEMNFELSSDSLGLGAKITGRFKELVSGDTIRLHIFPDLQMFQRRIKPRIDCRTGIRFTRGRGSLQSMRESWEKNVKVLTSGKPLPALKGFNDCKINLSSGGIRFAVKPPAEPADLCLLLLDIEDEKPPICALAEIIWSIPDQDGEVLLTGMQFLNITVEDQKRIDNFASRKKKKA
ncbi:MAG TPA: PilZ domain-containing protein [Geopsychrobacteraceae bacterium]|nr:PilZ domain-containing protein [Geopsychrobacteraceae bacterium]